MSTDNNAFDKFARLMDQNIKGVQYGVYSIAGIGLIVALRSVRPFKKFVLPKDIPRNFVDKRMRLTGRVLKVPGDRLYIDHHPIISLPFRSSQSTGLPLKISSIKVSSNGGIWLNSILKGKDVNFIPLRTDDDVVEGIVLNKRQDVAQHLVSIGFATAAPLDFQMDKDPIYIKYYKSLIASERKAEIKGAGIWQDQKSGFFNKIRNYIHNIRYSLA